MTAQAISLHSSTPANLRRFDVRRDLLAVANLVELCFADTLDADGRLYIEQMRRTARSNLITKLASSSPRGPLPMSGYVWVEQGRLVGNLSLIEHRAAGPHTYLIANVAVHPDHRRQGIAHAMTEAALAEIGETRRAQVWLQVVQNNQAAIKLYQSMGFSEEARRTSWRAHPRPFGPPDPAPELAVRKVRSGDWRRQQAWLANLYPPQIRWNLPYHEGLIDPGWRGAFYRMFNDRAVIQWAALQGRELLGVLSWQSSTLSADRLWLALPPDPAPEIIEALMHSAFGQLSSERELALNFPAGLAGAALDACGFEARRTLIWMRLPK